MDDVRPMAFYNEFLKIVSVVILDHAQELRRNPT